jgi:hypothetical protein
MARSFVISNIIQSGGLNSPGQIVLTSAAGNVVQSFHGRFFRQNVSPFGTLPGYTAPAPAGYTLIQATSFSIVDNPSYDGRYTVYTPISLVDAGVNPSSVFVSSQTTIRVNEPIGAPLVASHTTSGRVTNITTYQLKIFNESDLFVPPTVVLEDRPLEIIGRNGQPWAEAFLQNYLELAQNFAGPTAPSNPYFGQTWYNSTANILNLRVGSSWVPIASGLSGNTTFRHTQAAPSTTWTINHNLNLAAPFIAMYQTFVDVGGGVYKEMLPSDMSFVSANQMTVTFTSAQSGFALVRS